MKVRRTTSALVAAGALALAVSGCSSKTASSAAIPASLEGGTAAATTSAAAGSTPLLAPASSPVRAPAAIGAPTDAAGGTSKGSDAFVTNGDVSPLVARQVISTAQLTVEAKDVPAAVTSVAQIALQQGGRIDAQKVAARQDGGHDATVVVKVPPAKYDETIAKLSALGTPRSLDQSTQDVTGNVTDLESRVATEAKSIKRIQAFMDKATSIKDIVILEGELTAREATLESQQAQANALRGQAAMGTITATFVEPNVIPPAKEKSVPPVHRSGFSAGLHNGWHAFTATVVVIMTAAGALAPFAIPALLALAIWILVRRRRRTVAVIAPPSEPVAT